MAWTQCSLFALPPPPLPLPFQVNNVDFANIIREEAVLFLLDLPKGEEVTILAQKKKDGEFVEEKGGSAVS